MDSVDLKMFESVARTGGITQAARELNTVQSNVTARIQRLERELGIALFERHSRGVTLTQAGQDLLPYATRANALLTDARRAVTDQKQPRGPLLIGSLQTAAAIRLPPILTEYARQCPQVDIAVQTGTGDELFERVVLGRLDAAFVAGPVTHPDLISTPVIDEELVLISSREIRDVDAWIASQPGVKALAFRIGCHYRRRLETILAERGSLGVRWMEFGTLEGIIGCVSAGLGVSLLPRSAVEAAVRAKRICAHRVSRRHAHARVVLIRRRSETPSIALRRFIECAVSQRSVVLKSA